MGDPPPSDKNQQTMCLRQSRRQRQLRLPHLYGPGHPPYIVFNSHTKVWLHNHLGDQTLYKWGSWFINMYTDQMIDIKDDMWSLLLLNYYCNTATKAKDALWKILCKIGILWDLLINQYRSVRLNILTSLVCTWIS